MLRTFFCFILLTILVQKGISESIKCYSCETNDEGCGREFDKNAAKVVTCPKTEHCQKIKHFSIGAFVEPISRGCSDGKECDSLNVCFECNEDLCNSAHYLKPLFIVIIACALHYLFE
ncbi:hypothetical protein ILUMI_12489 [Ignelater luminosus]|uniref:Protein sleepless n=1 Tax=Ignelater luminosus TaxID=2038154 RepID=A0A8K0GC96_IGNLU|nr:hypothetical protein ILUMI_12489 [Ignelater luminosus]